MSSQYDFPQTQFPPSKKQKSHRCPRAQPRSVRLCGRGLAAGLSGLQEVDLGLGQGRRRRRRQEQVPVKKIFFSFSLCSFFWGETKFSPLVVSYSCILIGKRCSLSFQVYFLFTVRSTTILCIQLLGCWHGNRRLVLFPFPFLAFEIALFVATYRILHTSHIILCSKLVNLVHCHYGTIAEAPFQVTVREGGRLAGPNKIAYS